jgi:hypothetical protein
MVFERYFRGVVMKYLMKYSFLLFRGTSFGKSQPVSNMLLFVVMLNHPIPSLGVHKDQLVTMEAQKIVHCFHLE